MNACQNPKCKAYQIPVSSSLVLIGEFKCFVCQSNLGTNVDSTFLDLSILNDFPSLVSKPYYVMMTRQEIDAKIRRMLDVYTGILKLTATILETEYLHSDRLDEHLTKIIIKDLKNPTLGKWLFFCKELTIEKKMVGFVFPEIADYFVKTYSSFSNLLEYRNQFHHEYQGNEEKLEIEFKKLLPELHSLLNLFPLNFQIFAKTESGKIYKLTGIRPKEVVLDEGHFRKSETILSDGSSRSLPLFPLHALNEEKDIEPIVYVSSTDRRIIYEGLQGETVDTVRTFQRFNELLERKIAKRNILSTFNPFELKTRIAEESKKNLDLLKEAKKYEADLFVSREIADREFTKFLSSSEFCLLITANSGGGKTSFLCNQVERLLDDTYPVLFLEGRQFFENLIENQIQSFLQIDFKFFEALETFPLDSRFRAKGLLIIDAVNEAKNPLELLENLLKLREKINRSGIKLILSVREDFWQNWKEKDIFFQKEFFFLPLNEFNEPEKEPKLFLGKLTKKERISIFQNFRGDIQKIPDLETNRPLWNYLSSPIHIKFFAAIQNDLTRGELNPNNIQSLYFTNVILNRKQNYKEFVRTLASIMLQTDSSEILLDDAWEDNDLKKFLTDRRPDSPFVSLKKDQVLIETRKGDRDFIGFVYDLYSEEAIALALNSKPYSGKGRNLLALDKTNLIINSAIASSLLRSAENQTFKEILEYINEYSGKEFNVIRHFIRKISAHSLEMLNEFSKQFFENFRSEWSEIAVELTYELNQRLQYEENIKYLSPILSNLENSANANTDFAALASIAGNSFYANGDYTGAFKMYDLSLDLYKKNTTDDHPDLITCYLYLANTYYSLGEYEKSLENDRICLDLRIKKYGENHVDVAMSYLNLGSTYNALGIYQEALKFDLKSLEIKEKILEPDHPHLAMSYNNIGLTYYCVQKYDLALEKYNQSLEIRYRAFGPEHPDVAGTLLNIGIVYDSLDQFDTALDYYLKSLRAYKKLYGNNHPHVALNYSNIGSTYQSKGLFRKAILYRKKGLKYYSKINGREHPNVASILLGLGKSYEEMGKFTEAEKHYNEAHRIFLNFYPENHPSLSSLYLSMSVLYDRTSNFNLALSWASRALKNYESDEESIVEANAVKEHIEKLKKKIQEF